MISVIPWCVFMVLDTKQSILSILMMQEKMIEIIFVSLNLFVTCALYEKKY